MIKAFCIEGFKQEYLKNKKQVDLKLGEDICDCFVKRINDNESLESAREACKEDAIKILDSKTI